MDAAREKRAGAHAALYAASEKRAVLYAVMDVAHVHRSDLPAVMHAARKKMHAARQNGNVLCYTPYWMWHVNNVLTYLP